MHAKDLLKGYAEAYASLSLFLFFFVHKFQQ